MGRNSRAAEGVGKRQRGVEARRSWGRGPAPRLTSALVLVVLLLAGCQYFARPPAPVRAAQVTPFSIATPGGDWPGGWHMEAVPKLRKPSSYRLVENGGATVVEGTADASASGLVQFLDIDPYQRPILTWRWRVTQPVAGADTTRREGEDAAVRVMVSFAGDIGSLPFSDRLFFEQVRTLTGVQVPYATLEYVWGGGAPKETVVLNSYTPRIRILLVQSGPQPLDEWVTESRDVVADFRRAFGEEPGRITGIAIYTDADATGAWSQGYFGDIAFLTRSEAELRTGAERNTSTGY